MDRNLTEVRDSCKGHRQQCKKLNSKARTCRRGNSGEMEDEAGFCCAVPQ